MSYSLSLLAFLDELELNPAWDAELRDLWLIQQDFAVSPTLVITAEAEEQFYRLNNLPEQLRLLFAQVNVQNPDEDDIEELEPKALALFKKHFFLDEFIDAFYLALKRLPSRVAVRRVGEKGNLTSTGRPALIAVKEQWARSWTFEMLLSRLIENASIAVEARPLLIQARSEAAVISNAEISKRLSQNVTLALDEEQRISRIFY